jgi:hypothetical protein
VRHPKEAHGERPGGRLLAGGDRLQIDEMGDLVLIELALKQGEGECRAVDLETAIDIAEQVRERADVILVPVGEDNSLDPVGLLPNEVEVGQDEVDAGHVAVREGQADVDDQDPAVELEAGHVPTHLAHPAEEDESRRRLRGDRRPPVLCGPAHARPP